MKVVIDRFEGNYAVCEIQGEKRMINLQRSDMPEGVKEGTILLVTDSGITIDIDGTEKQEKKIKKLMDSLWE